MGVVNYGINYLLLNDDQLESDWDNTHHELQLNIISDLAAHAADWDGVALFVSREHCQGK